jgi:acyl transferase domain-containing protein/2-polyprenyl-3-methyl-5-hydroxy-6-metoxy-1,4-benzoquinol methylase
MTIDTACSSSLVALHQACEAIRSSTSHCRQAIVGGANLVLLPDSMVALNPLHFLSVDSKCFSFDKRANGFVRGEGVGILVLKHIDDAIRDNDCIRAVIRGTGVNQDGKTPGITLPSSDAQKSLIQAAYAAANLPLDETSYFEAHGTGTQAGDAMEVTALANVFNRTSPESLPLYIGSVKPNIGHLEGAAGVAGLIKTILALERAVIPPNINFKDPNPKLRLEERNFKVPTEPSPWPAPGLRRASVNSFGYGGTNAHCIIDDPFHYLLEQGIYGRTRTADVVPMPSPNPEDDDSGISLEDEIEAMEQKAIRRTLFILSAPDQAALPRLAKSHAEHLRDVTPSNTKRREDLFEDLAYTYSSRRSFFQWRTSLIASDITDLTDQLFNTLNPVRVAKASGIVFCFTGQGAQWFGMGRELMIYDIYRESVERADAYLTDVLGAPFSAIDELNKSEKTSRINKPQYSQPCCTIVQVALVDLLHHWGIRPKIVVGHSSGEIASAYAYGALTAEECWKIGYHRGRLCGQVRTIAPHLNGGMLAVGLGPKEVEPYVQKLGVTENDTLTIGCYNSPKNITMSGDVPLIEKLEADLKADSVFCRRIMVDNAYHSAHIKVIADLFREAIADIQPKEVTEDIVMFSSVTAGAVQWSDLDMNYWIGNTLSPASFTQALEAALLAAGKSNRRKTATLKVPAVDTIIEIGPHGALQGPIRQILESVKKSESIAYASALIRRKSAVESALFMAGFLWCRGFDIALDRVNSTTNTPELRIPLTNLPKYPWNHENSYWHESKISQSHRFRESPRTDLLGAPVLEFSSHDPVWKNIIRLSEQPWILDHRVKESILYPAAGMLCAALEAAKYLSDKSRKVRCYELRDVIVGRALVIAFSDPGVEVFTKLKPQSEVLPTDLCHSYDFSFSSLEGPSFQDRNFVEHGSGTVIICYENVHRLEDAEQDIDLAAIRAEYQNALSQCSNVVTGEEHYKTVRDIGIEYGPTFQGLKSARTRSGQATVELEIQDTKSTMPSNFEYPFLLHPATLDAAMHSAIQAFDTKSRASGGAMVPTGFDKITISANIQTIPGTKLSGFANSTRIGFKDAIAQVHLSTEDWPETMIDIRNMTLTNLMDSSNRKEADEQQANMRRIAASQVWKPAIDLIDTTTDDAERIFTQSIQPPEETTKFATAGTKAAAIFIKRALMFVTPEIESQLSEHASHLVKWMREKEVQAKSGRLDYQPETEDWFNLSFDEEEKEIQHCVDTIGAEGECLRLIGRNLPHIISGIFQPIQLLLDSGLLSRLYSEAIGLKSIIRMFENWFDLQGHKCPGMKILEVGAGTGSMTLPVLKVLSESGGSLPRLSSYCFTDISPSFFEKASEMLEQWSSLMEYKKLDIEKDPIGQGFAPESFDVIVASNVLHATSRVDVTLKNCLKLLKPGGKITIGEITWKSDHIGLIFGTMPGWWLSEDGRQGGPLISPDEWKQRLLDVGFAINEQPVSARDTSGNALTSMIVAHKPLAPQDPNSNLLVIKPVIPSAAGDNLVEMMQEHYSNTSTSVVSVTMEQACQMIEDDTLWQSNDAVVSFIEAFDPVFARCNEEQFGAIQRLVVKSPKLLWVSCRVSPNGVQEPDACAISGLLRVSKSENPGLSLHELHLRKRELLELQEATNLITRVIDRLWNHPLSDEIESDIVEINGKLQIPRLFDNVSMNKALLALDGMVHPELSPLTQENRPLKLTIETPGVLSSLHFIDDTICESEISGDEVEIEIKATGLALK